MDKEQHRQVFIEEARENIQVLTESLLILEKDPQNADALNKIFRSAHTLKGSSAMMGFKDVSNLAHVMEDVFDGLREGGQVSSSLITVLFDCIDTLTTRLGNIQNRIDDKIEVDQFVRRLRKVSKGAARTFEHEEATPAAQDEKESKAVVDVRSAQTVRVHFDQLDKLVNLVGELVINKIALLQIVSRNEYGSLKRVTGNIDRLTADLQDLVMHIRMVPVIQIFKRFPRLVRDSSSRKGKIIDLVMEGGEIEVDRTVLDEIGEPLMHLIRNSVDHGIETPDERKRRRKNPTGTIRLTAKRREDHIIIEVEDDGAGIDPEKIKKSAVEKDFISEIEVEKMSEEQVMNLVFLPGVSTAEEVTETSGRGVGLDVVKTKIAALGGTAHLETQIGEGTKVTLRLPLTLAIVRSLLVKDSDQTFAIPTSQVSEVIRVNRGKVKPLGNFRAIEVRGHVLPLLHLRDLLNLQGGEEPEQLEVLVTLGSNENEKTGLVVGSVIGLQEVLIKPLDKTLANVKGLSGATILGDGRVVLVLDLAGFSSR